MKSFAEFWPFYLKEHSNPTNRRLHFVGTLLVHLILIYSLATQQWMLLTALPILGYGFAWVGHFIIEKNRPATFTHPLWSLAGDFKMFYLMLFGKLK
ncbi:Mpo1-like protein [Bdellovibrio sp. HCB337]|uniref:Mpo1-like protein n=1 Tax=Bdellovibrio sp. HCB337 TaxID=3394358 RepID=UPI0039A41D4D